MVKLLFGVCVLFFSPGAAFAAEVMFEGYYKVELNGKHIGYVIQRYEFEPKDKTFQTISFMRVSLGDKILQESLKAKSNDKFQPVSYQYTVQEGDTLKAIDASFKGEIMKTKTVEGKKVTDQTYKIPKDTYLSSFLTYLILQKKLELKKAWSYSAVAEEEGNSYGGKAMIISKENKTGYEANQIANSFKNEDFMATVGVVKDEKDPTKNVRGEVLGTSSPSKNLSTTLVKSPAIATEGQTIPNKVLISLFGAMPTGKSNLLAKESLTVKDK